MINRDKDYVKLLNSMRWLRLRRSKLNKNPLCEECEKEGFVSPATEVHHIVPIQTAVTYNEKEALAYDINNLMSLCHRCHVDIHKSLGKQSKAETKERNKKLVNDTINRFFG